MKRPRKFTIREIRRAQRRTANLYDTYFTRNVSVWITAALAPWSTPPNAVSLLNFGVGIAACVLIAFGQSSTEVIVGLLLVHLYAVLDSVDGELARLLDQRSLRGMFLEDWSAYCMMTAFPLAAALYLQSAAGSAAPVVLAVLYAVLGRNAMPALRRAIMGAATSPATELPPGPAGERSGHLAGWKALVEDHVLHQTNIRLVLTALIAVHIAAGTLVPLAIMYYGYMAALFLREAGILYLAVRGGLIQQEQQWLRGRTPEAGQTGSFVPQ